MLAVTSDEFTLIERYFAPLTGGNIAALSLKDDAAILPCQAGQQMVVTKDILVESVHFFPGDNPEMLAQKALRVNLSDLAAMGAKPVGYFLGLVLPKDITENWLTSFSNGLQKDNQYFGVNLLGGDTVAHEGKLMISITAWGSVPENHSIQRRGAHVGDKIYVSGTLGDAALGLAILNQTLTLTNLTYREFLISRYHLPQPRIALGQALRSLATAGMDISDGLVQDLGHITRCSGVGAEIDAEAIPLSEAAKVVMEGYPDHGQAALSGGDDYELLFTVPPAQEVPLQELAKTLSCKITCIGKVVAGQGVSVYDAERKPITVKNAGYRHFS